MKIHPEGRTTLFLALLLLSLLNVALIYALPEARWLHNSMILVSIGLYIFLLQFFRDPERQTPQVSNAVIAPADGKVVVIEQVFEPEYFKDERIQVSIFMSPFNVHVNRNPVSGRVAYFKYHPGKYLVAWHPKSSTENERTTLVIQQANSTAILLRQIAGALARRIRWYVKEAQPVQQGAQFGFIKFGSRVDIFLPLNAQIQAKLGDTTRGGETILALLPE